jgi:hypothetical protein
MPREEMKTVPTTEQDVDVGRRKRESRILILL